MKPRRPAVLLATVLLGTVLHATRRKPEVEQRELAPQLLGANVEARSRALDALVDFGEQAAPAVLAVVMSPQSDCNSVNNGLMTLRMMIEDAGTRPAPRRHRGEIRRVAEHFLTV